MELQVFNLLAIDTAEIVLNTSVKTYTKSLLMKDLRAFIVKPYFFV